MSVDKKQFINLQALETLASVTSTEFTDIRGSLSNAGGKDFSADIENLNLAIAGLSEAIATISGGGFSYYIGNNPPADFDGLIFDTSGY